MSQETIAPASSLDNRYSRYVQGGETSINSVGLDWWDRRILPKDPTDLIYYVENKYENRIDLLATIFYGDARYWWVIAQCNDILDPYFEITAGRMLIIPTKSRVLSNIFTQ